MLIFDHTLRDSSYSQEEQEVSSKLIKMYHDFATRSEIVYDNMRMEPVDTEDITTMEITKEGGSIEQVDESFGNQGFWDEIENTLKTKERTFYDEL